MQTLTTVFKNGPSTQAVRIPQKYRFDTNQVSIRKIGNVLVIAPVQSSWDDFFYKTPPISADFSMKRNQELPQDRDELFK